MKRKVITVLMVMAMLAIYAGTAFGVSASGSQNRDWNLVGEKTGIRCTSVYNVAGYGVVEIEKPGGEYYEGQYGLVGPDGKYVIQPKLVQENVRWDTYGNTFFISDGIICDYNRGYYNLDGSVAFDIHIYKSSFPEEPQPYYEVALPFYNGKALTEASYQYYQTDDGQGWFESEDSPLYTVDAKGNVLRESENVPRMFYGGEGLWMETDVSSYAIYRDYDGVVKVDLTGRGYQRFGTYKDGYAWVGRGALGPYGFIDAGGTEVIACIYDNVGLFNDGLAAVEKDGLYGYINTRGQTVIPIEFEGFGGAGGSLATVKKDGRYGFVDYDNKQVMAYEWDDLSSFEGEVAYGIKNGELYVIKNNPASKPFNPIVAVVITGVTAVGAGAAAMAMKAKAAIKNPAKPVKVRFGHRTVLAVSQDEKLIDFLKNQSNLKVRTGEYDQLTEKIKEVDPDLILLETSSDQQLKEYLATRITEENKKIAHGFIISEEIGEETRRTLDELKKQKKIISYLPQGTSPYKVMSEIVLPVMKPDVSSDASLANIGAVADALGIPGISAILDVYSTGRD
ncbi:MAG: WG repeat-containing protein, partial [Erysipelotrichaceae bacterium]|nr:WG repeat-containing protein [Erysipelotrichaceae bacterium]